MSNDLCSLLDQARDHAVEHIDGLDDRPVFPPPAAIEALGVFDEALPRSGADAAETLRLLHERGGPATVAATGGRYFGFVTGGALPAAVAARWLADVWDQCAALTVMSPVAGKLEAVCERWLAELLGLPPGTACGFVSGASVSLLCGLAAARWELLRRQGWDVSAKGLYGAPEIRVVVSEAAHATVFRSLALLGLGRERVEWVAADQEGAMRADALPKLDDRTLLLFQAGNVNSGAFDPFAEIVPRAEAAGAWSHVDGAFGLWAAAAPALRHLCAGAERANSWSCDAHKTLNAPYDSGLVLCRDAGALAAAMQASGAYLQWDATRDGMRYTPEMSRRARAIELWAALRTLGAEGVAALVEQLCARARRFAEQLDAAGFRILNDVVFNQVLVAGATGEETRAVLAGVQRSGECWCGGTTWRGAPAIRISVSSWATTEADVDRSVRAFIAARDSC